MTAVVLRLPRARADQLDAERDQPRRERGKPTARPGRDEWRTVVALDGPRRAVLGEELLENPSYAGAVSAGEEPGRQHEPAVRIANCKRLALLSVASSPPAFEVHRPEIVRPRDLHVRTTVNGPDPHRCPTALHFAEASQSARDRALARSGCTESRDQNSRDLVRAPARMLISELEDGEHHVLAGAARRRVRTSPLLDDSQWPQLAVAA